MWLESLYKIVQVLLNLIRFIMDMITTSCTGSIVQMALMMRGHKSLPKKGTEVETIASDGEHYSNRT